MSPALRRFLAPAGDLLAALRARTGWPGAVGLGLLLAVAAGHFLLYRPEVERIAQLKVELRRLGAPKESRAAEPQPLRAQMMAFYKLFPSADHASETLDRIVTVAEAGGLKLEQGEYRFVRDIAGDLVQMQIQFPVKAAYPQVRKFIAGSLDAVPSLALESVHLERDKVGESNIEARVRFIAYLRASPQAGAERDSDAGAAPVAPGGAAAGATSAAPAPTAASAAPAKSETSASPAKPEASAVSAAPAVPTKPAAPAGPAAAAPTAPASSAAPTKTAAPAKPAATATPMTPAASATSTAPAASAAPASPAAPTKPAASAATPAPAATAGRPAEARK
jgi:hypothetical protein